jgi:3-deoxy-D-manno-octulosonic-acid transferase
VIYLLYSITLWLGSPLVLLYFLLYRGIKDRRYFRHLGERLGNLSSAFHRTVPGAIWLHAVSVGEILSSIQLLKELRAASPNTPLFASTTTLAGRALAAEKLADLADGVFYVPIDFRFAVRRVLRALKPALVVILETEIWPNLYREPKLAGCAVAIVNGRISNRAAPRYRNFAWFFRAVLSQPDRIWVQSVQDLRRYCELLGPDRSGCVLDGGNLKFDFNPAAQPIPEPIQAWLNQTNPSAILIAASTMPPAAAGDPDEDEAVIQAFRQLAPDREKLLLILVPRRPERFDWAAQLLDRAAIRYTRRSRLEDVQLPGVLLLDSMGELSSLLQTATVVFIGGTLAHRGGHNILEPAYFGKPVVIGPHMENFPAIAAEFRAAQAVVEISTRDDLAPAIAKLLDQEALRQEVGERGQRIALSKRGVAARIAGQLLDLHANALPRDIHSPAAKAMLAPLSWIWGAFARNGNNARTLHTPVISLGGITMGGTGKTPMAIWLAERLRTAGLQPAILTRGYHRQSPHREVVVPAGAAAPIELTGDEAQIFVQRGVAHVGIDADRYRAGRRVEDLLHPSVFLLDDGFQHRRLGRTLDIVLIDALDPFGGGGVFPLGRLREPIGNLRRAHIFILTRAEPGRRTDGLEAELRRHNPRAPIFRSHVSPARWRGGTPNGPVAAFCGLANPNTFWRVLQDLGLVAALQWTFDDHHKYSCVEAARMAAQTRAAGLEYLVTTEKDYMNWSAKTFDALGEIKLCWLEVDVRMEAEPDFLGIVIHSTIGTGNR